MADAANAAAGTGTPAATPAKAPGVRGYIPALDGVRGLAVLMVLVFHFFGGMQATNAAEEGLNKVLGHGALGVELFFVLSGFLITGILFDSSPKPNYFRNFYMRRLLRIFPLYYGVLTVLFVVMPLVPRFQGPELEFLRERQLWAWLYAVNVYIAVHGAWALSYLDHFWSLCVEEQFYFIWPLLVWVGAGNPRRLMWTSLAISLGAMASRAAGNMAGLNWWTTYVLLPFRLDGLALGGFLAMLARQPDGMGIIRRNLPRVATTAAVLAAGTLAWVKISQRGLPFVHSVRVSLYIVLLACLLMWAVVAPERSWVSRFFRTRTMVFFGTYSYGLYVYHHFISYYMLHHRTEFALQRWTGSHLGAVILQSVVGIAVTLVVAYASYQLFERRFLSLKRFFEPARQG